MRGLRCLCLGCCVIRRDLQPCIGRWGTLLPVALKVTGPGQVASPSSDTPLCVCVCVCVGEGLWEKSLKIVYDQSGDRARDTILHYYWWW